MIGKNLLSVLEEYPDEIQYGINTLSQGISIFNKNLILIFFNTRFQLILDLPEDLLIRKPHFSELIRYNAERGEYGDCDIDEKVKEMVALAEEFKPHQFIRTTKRGITLEVKGLPLQEGGFVTTYTDISDLISTQHQLEEASRRFQDFTESASDWYWETDENYYFSFLSDRLEASLGIPASSLLGKKRGEFSANPDDPMWAEHHKVTQAKLPFNDFVYELTAKDGTSKFCSISGKPVFSKDGIFLGYRGVGKEITEKVLSDQEKERALSDQIILSEILKLSLSEKPLNIVLEEILRIIFKFNRRGFKDKGCIFLSKDFENKLVMEASVGMPPEVISSCKTVNFGQCLCGKAAENRSFLYKPHIDVDHEITFEDAEPHGHYCVPIKDDENLLGLFNLYIDDGHKQDNDEIQFLTSIANTLSGIITRWKTQKEHQKLTQAIEQNPAAIVITDTTGKITYINKSFTDSSGYTFEDVQGKTPRILKSGATPAEEYEALWKKISSGKVWRGVFHNKTKSGERIWERATIVPIKNRRNKVVSYVGIKENITDSKAQEKERKRLEYELQQAQKMEAIGQLAGGIAHEINTPTQYVSDNLLFLKETWNDLKELHQLYDEVCTFSKDKPELSEVIENITELKEDLDYELLSEDIEEALSDAVEGTTQISRIVKAMKDFSHPGQKEMVMADLNQALKSTSTVCKNEWKYVSEIEFDLDETLPQIQCLPGELNQVFLNLIVNAAHAIEERNKIEGDNIVRPIIIHTKSKGDFIEVHVTDEGNGIPEKARDKIFNPFFTTKIIGKGTGQGLSISHDVIVNKHNGRIWFETETGTGTTFKVSLPVEHKPLSSERGKS